MNHEKVSVLDGGLPRYQKEGFEVDEQPLTSEDEGVARARPEGKVRLPIKLASTSLPNPKLMPWIALTVRLPGTISQEISHQK